MVATRVDDDLLKIEKKNVDQKSTEKLKQIYAPAGGAKLHPSPKRFKTYCKFSDSALAAGMTKGTALAAVELVLEGGGPMGCGGRMEPFALAATPQLLAGHPHQKKHIWGVNYLQPRHWRVLEIFLGACP